MRIQTSELIGPALDWAVAKCEGHPVGLYSVDEQWERFASGCSADDLMKYADKFARVKTGFKPELCKIHSDGYKSVLDAMSWKFSTDWAQGGQIIERENITLIRANDGWFAETDRWIGHTLHTSYEGEYMDPTFMIEESSGYYGPTPLVAAMRSFVASKLGDEIDVPEELLK